MPELPEVETTRCGLLKTVKGQRIDEVELRRGDLRFPFPGDLQERLIGHTITDIRRRAKYLLIDLDSNDVLLAHLGMSGSFRVIPAAGYEPKKHDHVILHLANGTLCVFHDPRRFGIIDVFGQKEEGGHALLAHLGPEPLSRDFTANYLAKALQRRKGPIKPVLMDQKLVVGVGNIYASESLFLAGIHPDTPAHKTLQKAPQLVESIRTVLNAAIASGGSTLRDFLGADGASGYFQHRFNVYERENEPCTNCKTSIRSAVHAGRSTYWCPQCQPLRDKVRKP